MGGDIEEGVGVEVRGGRDVSADLCVSDESYQDFLEVLSSPSTLSQDPEATRPSRDPPAWTSEGRVPSVQFANAPGKEYNHSLTKDIDSYSSSERAEKGKCECVKWVAGFSVAMGGDGASILNKLH